MAGSTVIQLGGLTVSENFPVYGSSFEFMRMDDQGPAYRKITVTLSGFMYGTDSGAVASLFNTLRALVGKSDTTLTITDNGTAVYANQKVWVASYNEPEDKEYARNRIGDYSITLYYFSDAIEADKAIPCSFNGYTFPKTPKWGRNLKENRDSPTSVKRGATIGIQLSGYIFGDTHATVMAAALAMQDAMRGDADGKGTLVYGDFSQLVYFVDCDLDPTVVNNVIQYTIKFEYYSSSIIKLSRKVSIPRVHYNPVITEEPFCDRRLVELMNLSSQTITYTFAMQSTTIAGCRALLATEVYNTVEPGGLEMPGGVEEWDLENNSVNLSIVKFYNAPIIANT